MTTIDDHRLLARHQAHDRRHARCLAPGTSDNFTIFEGTSEIQRITEWSIPGFMHTWFCVTQLRQVALL